MKLLISILIGVITALTCKGREFTDFSQLSVEAKFEAMEDIIDQNKMLTMRLDQLESKYNKLESLIANLIQKVCMYYSHIIYLLIQWFKSRLHY